MDDTWWAFVAGIDRASLIQEAPGSASDRHMREQHAVTRDAYWRAERAREGTNANTVEQQEAATRLQTAKQEAVGWRQRHGIVETRPPMTPLEEQIAVYAAKRRAQHARKVA